MHRLREGHAVSEDQPMPAVPAEERLCEPEVRELRQDLSTPSLPPRALPTKNRHSRETWSSLQQAMRRQDLKALLVVRPTGREQMAVQLRNAGVLWA
jgi:hypothetical protein